MGRGLIPILMGHIILEIFKTDKEADMEFFIMDIMRVLKEYGEKVD